MKLGEPGEQSLEWARPLLRTRLYRNLLLYCMVAASLIVFSIWLWFRAASGGFLRDALAPTLLGSAVTALAAFGSLAVIATREIQERRQLNAFEHAPAKQRPTLRLGNLRINNIRVIAAGSDLENRFHFDVTTTNSGRPTQRPDPPEWPSLESGFLPELQARAAERRQVLFDDEKLDLLDAVKRRDIVDGHPVTVYELTVGVTTYFRFAAMSNALDEELDDVLAGFGTLRERWDRHPLTPEHVAALPAPAALGCGVVVVTEDDQIVLLERASTYVGGSLPDDRRTAVHIVAEGMIPSDLRSGDPLRAAAYRALDEELGIDVAEAGLEPLRSLEMIGFFFDTQRWQPCFVWLARLSISLDELATLHSVARDGWETASIFGIPFDVRADQTRALLLKQHENLVPATNHASACVALALVANDGVVLCRAALSWGVRRSRRAAGPNFQVSQRGSAPLKQR